MPTKSRLSPSVILGILFLSLVLSLAWFSELASATAVTCAVFPQDNVWNAPVDTLPVDPHSEAYDNSIGMAAWLRPDFGSGTWDGGPIGIPYATVPGSQRLVAIHYTANVDESDPGPFPIPPDAPIEGGQAGSGDRHVVAIDQDDCRLFELFNAFPQPDGSWNADSGAKYDLNSNVLRPDNWTSADAAGLPIFPGLVHYDEVAAGSINHALRFTAQHTQKKHVWPARHDASSSTDPSLPPMGMRFRLKSSFDITQFPARMKVILIALKTYGMILADNGSNWYLSGVPDANWNDDELVTWLSLVKG